jgi:hypothetical protein
VALALIARLLRTGAVGAARLAEEAPAAWWLALWSCIVAARCELRVCGRAGAMPMGVAAMRMPREEWWSCTGARGTQRRAGWWEQQRGLRR